jgi:DNA gyrase/topoisomerase IV subunit A
MVCVDDPGCEILVVSERGYGKRSSLEDYRITNRGAKGVKTINVTDKTKEFEFLDPFGIERLENSPVNTNTRYILHN